MASNSTVGLTEVRASSGSSGSEHSEAADRLRHNVQSDANANGKQDSLNTAAGGVETKSDSRTESSNGKSFAPDTYHSGLWRNNKYGRGSFNTEGVFSWTPAHGSGSVKSISFDGKDLLYVQIKGKCETPTETNDNFSSETDIDSNYSNQDVNGDMTNVVREVDHANTGQDSIEMEERLEVKGRKGSTSSLSAINAVLTRSIPPDSHEIYLFEVTYADTTTVNDSVWKIEKLVLGCVSQESLIQWVSVLQDNINAQRKTHRPNKLLVFINPYGGRGYAETIYNEQVRPLFSKCRVTADVTMTTHADHARDVVNSTERLGEKYDGVIVVGGDGLLSEVINGILTRRSRETIKRLRIGIIPAGSTNCVLYSAQGGDDVTTAALQIILGSRMSLDLGSVWQGKRLKKYFASMGAYGFFGDVVHTSEHHRWMGPARYDFSGFKTFMRKKAYRGKVFLRNTGKRRGHCGVCRINCPGCDNDAEETSAPPTRHNEDGVCVRDPPFTLYDVLSQSPVGESLVDTNDSTAHGETSPTNTHIHSQPQTQADVDRPLPTYSDAQLRQESIAATNGTNMKHETITETQKDTDQGIELANTHGAPAGPSPEGWEVIEGDFICVNATIMSCRCPKSPNGMSPHGHLSDGCIDLILVRNVNRAQYLAQLTCLANPTADHLSFDFVEFTKVTEFYFVPSAPEDKEDNTEWVVDGEPLGTDTIHCQVHSNLIHLFQRRPLTLHKSKPNLIHKASERLEDATKKKRQFSETAADVPSAGDDRTVAVSSDLEEGSFSSMVGSMGLGMCMSPGTAEAPVPTSAAIDGVNSNSISHEVHSNSMDAGAAGYNRANIRNNGGGDSAQTGDSSGAGGSEGVADVASTDSLDYGARHESVTHATLKMTPSLLNLSAEDASVIVRPPPSHLIPAKREDI